MALPANWNLVRPPSGVRSIRFYQTGTSTSLFSDNAFILAEQAAAVTYTPLPVVAPGSTATVNIPATPWGGGTGDGVPDPQGNGQSSSVKMIWSSSFIIRNTGTGTLEFSFDGTNVHGQVPAGSYQVYNNRYEARIAVRGNGGTPTFAIEAW